MYVMLIRRARIALANWMYVKTQRDVDICMRRTVPRRASERVSKLTDAQNGQPSLPSVLLYKYFLFKLGFASLGQRCKR